MCDGRFVVHIETYKNIEELSNGAAKLFVTLSSECISKSNIFHVALSGGKTPKKMFERLCIERLREAIDWNNVHLFWGDERCVPPENETSNYRLVYDSCIKQIDIPDANIHRIKGELNPHEATVHYEHELKKAFSEGEFPCFDLIFLGLGEDGHTASIFPYSEAIHESKRLMIHTRKEGEDYERITTTFPVINHAKNIVFLVSGVNKSQALNSTIYGVFQPDRYPAQMVKPEQGSVYWLIDEDAATLIKGKIKVGE